MRTITVQITKSNIYHIAEGISAMISQHNGGTPSFELLWASPDEARKLDIYYREAISDLERHLTDWIDTASSQYNLQGDAGDYSLVLDVSLHWPQRLKGLLDNKVQDYLVHAVTAGWLNDFQGLEVKQDYQAMATQDVADIVSIVMMRSFGFQQSQRGNDPNEKPDGGFAAPEWRKIDANVKAEDSGLTPEQRKADEDAKTEAGGLTPEWRKVDANVKAEDGGLTPEWRKVDANVKAEDGGLTPEQRKTDTGKPSPVIGAEAGYRRKDDVTKMSNDDIPPYCRPKNLRHRDNDVVEHHEDWTDWSGTGMAFRDRMPHHLCGKPLELAGEGIPGVSRRVACGRGYTPSPFESRPVCEKPTPHPLKPHPKDPRIPDNPTHPNYPPVTSDGVNWSDDALYDAEGSEHYIND